MDEWSNDNTAIRKGNAAACTNSFVGLRHHSLHDDGDSFRHEQVALGEYYY